MTNKRSRFQPQDIHCQEDLPGRGAPEMDAPDIRDDFLSIDDVSLELSRASSLLRGPLLAICVFSASVLSFGLLRLIFEDILTDLREEFLIFTFLLVSLLAVYPLLFLLVRIELTMPLDMPVRFNRRQGKVFVYHR